MSRRKDFLAQALPKLTEQGWREDVLPKDFRLVFPGGLLELADFFCAQGDARLKPLKARIPVHEKIAQLVRRRLKSEDPQVVRPTVAFLAARGHVRPLWGTCDVIWRCAGDRSTDMNFYTKRLVLMGVFCATLLFWLEDSSKNKTHSWNFLQKRLQETAQLGQLGSQLGSQGLDVITSLFGNKHVA